MLTLTVNSLAVELLNPADTGDRARLGTRYCWGGYIWQVHDQQAGPLLTGPEWPHPTPTPFNGQGLPESFRHTEFGTERPLMLENGRGFILGVGEVAPGDDGKLSMTGGLAGGQLGYNYQTGNIVLGVEADFDYASLKGNHLFEFGGNPVNLDGELKSIGTVRARFGYAIDNLLIFATGGVAYGFTHAELTSIAPPSLSASGSKSYSGYVVGAGIEYGLSKNWTVKAEYLHADFGKRSNTYVFTDDLAEATADTSLKSNIVRIGLNYKF
jgi:outer membrane immunogenic protein